jgi:hypothetical protein
MSYDRFSAMGNNTLASKPWDTLIGWAAGAIWQAQKINARICRNVIPERIGAIPLNCPEKRENSHKPWLNRLTEVRFAADLRPPVAPIIGKDAKRQKPIIAW